MVLAGPISNSSLTKFIALVRDSRKLVSATFIAVAGKTTLLGCAALLLCQIASIPANAQPGITSRTRGLDQLTREADLAIHGYVTSTRTEPHPKLKNLMTIVVNMSVQDTYKGKTRKTLEFRQYIWDLRSQSGSGEYNKGEELVLLLGPVSEYGLTSPAGMDQGRFRVFRDAKGKLVAMNGRGNLGLFNSVEKRAAAAGLKLSPRVTALARQRQSGPLPLPDLAEAIRTFGGTR